MSPKTSIDGKRKRVWRIKRSYSLILATVTLMLLCAVASNAQTPPYPRTWTSWIGPRPFVTGATVRPDFHNVWDPPPTWDQIRTQTEVFKTYLNVLQNPAIPGQAGLTDSEVAGFVNATRGKQVAFEVSGLGNYPGTWCGSSLGENTWNQFDRDLLLRWVNPGGGQIDYITSDHAIAHIYFDGPNSCPLMSMQDIIGRLVDYFALAKAALPGVKVGLIESLGFWLFVTDSRTYYPLTSLTHNGVPQQIDLNSVLSELNSQAT